MRGDAPANRFRKVHMTANAYPESPCIGDCRLDDQRCHCLGCGRTLNEIANWSRMSVADKRAVLQRLATEDGAAPDRHRAG